MMEWKTKKATARFRFAKEKGQERSALVVVQTANSLF